MTVHDFRTHGMRSECCLEPVPGDEHRLHAYGWSTRSIAVGDVFLIPNTGSRAGYSRYAVETFRRPGNPRDQWFGTLRWLPSMVCSGCHAVLDPADAPSHDCT